MFFEDLLMFLGRLFISFTFLWTSYEKIKNWKRTTDYMKGKNVPKVEIIQPVSIALQILGSIMVLTGLYARLGSVFLLIYLVPATLWLHRYWTLQEQSQERKIEQMFFMKDLAITGALLLILAMGPGHWSF